MSECILYLNYNKDLWSDLDIRAANKVRKENNRKDIQAKIEVKAKWRKGDAAAVSDDILTLEAAQYVPYHSIIK